ncbi:MAG: DUF3574 domain-containing protein [Gemmatimonadales bacterium]
MTAIAACASRSAVAAPEPVPSCQAGETGLVRDVLYFGRNRPVGGEVADSDWNAFLTAVVTPRFPDGLTIVEAHGQWRDRSGVVERERTELVTLLHPADSASQQAVEEIANEYKRRFGQEAVLRERLAACTRFF